jgi:hypothetical protein
MSVVNNERQGHPYHNPYLGSSTTSRGAGKRARFQIDISFCYEVVLFVMGEGDRSQPMGGTTRT